MNGVKENWDNFDSFNHYDDFTINWLKVVENFKIKWFNGVIGSYHNIFRIGYILQNLGFWI